MTVFSLYPKCSLNIFLLFYFIMLRTFVGINQDLGNKLIRGYLTYSQPIFSLHARDVAICCKQWFRGGSEERLRWWEGRIDIICINFYTHNRQRRPSREVRKKFQWGRLPLHLFPLKFGTTVIEMSPKERRYGISIGTSCKGDISIKIQLTGGQKVFFFLMKSCRSLYSPPQPLRTLAVYQ